MKRILLALALLAALLVPAHAQIGGGGGGSGTITANTVTPGYFNLDPSLLPHWNSCVAKVRTLNSTTHCTLVILGDSTTVGTGGGTGGTSNITNARLYSWPTVLAKLLNGFVATSDNSIAGRGQTTAGTYQSYDPRVSLSGAGWLTTTFTSIGSSSFHYVTGGAGTFSFTPTDPFDTITVGWIKQAAGGTLTVNVDGGASLGTITTTGTPFSYVPPPFTATVSRGTHTVNLVANNDGVLDISWIKTSDSTKGFVDLIQSGWGGSTVTSWTGTGPLSQIGQFAPDLCIFNQTINDSNQAGGFSPVGTYQTLLGTMATQCKTTGDMIFMTGAPSNTTQATDGTLASYVAAMRSAAAAAGAPMIDITQRWISYANINPILPYFDALHQLAPGYADIAAAAFVPLALSPAPGGTTGTGVSVRATSPVLVGHPTFAGNLPVLSACGSGSPAMAAGSTDNSGQFTVGTTTATCTMTFAKAFTTSVRCMVQSGTTLAAFAYTYNLTAITVTATVLGGDLVDYRCDGT